MGSTPQLSTMLYAPRAVARDITTLRTGESGHVECAPDCCRRNRTGLLLDQVWKMGLWARALSLQMGPVDHDSWCAMGKGLSPEQTAEVGRASSWLAALAGPR